MSPETAERWVVISALIVAGVYAYRRVTEVVAEPPIKLANIAGQGSPPPLGTFVTAWGVTFLGVSVLASANAQLGGAFAILIATGDLLANTPALVADVAKHGGGQSGAKLSTSTSTSPAASVAEPGQNMFTDPFSGFPLLQPNPFTLPAAGVSSPFYVAPPATARAAK